MTDRQIRPTEKERREYFRIEDQVLLEHRPIDEAELESLRLRLADRIPDRFTVAANFATHSRAMNRILHGFSARSPELARYLRIMDQKLNQLARLFVMEEMALGVESALRVNLSAGGMVFPARSEIEPGALLELRFALLPEMIGVLAAARVVYCERAATGHPDHPWQVAVEYECIRETDRDLLCAHIMSRETELLRQQREQQGAEEE